MKKYILIVFVILLFPLSFASAIHDELSVFINSPKQDEGFVIGDVVNITWNATGTLYDTYQIVVGNSVANAFEQLYDKVSTVDLIPKNQTDFPWIVPDLLADFTEDSDYSPDEIEDSFYLQINLIEDDSVGGGIVATSDRVFFSISDDNDKEEEEKEKDNDDSKGGGLFPDLSSEKKTQILEFLFADDPDLLRLLELLILLGVL